MVLAKPQVTYANKLDLVIENLAQRINEFLSFQKAKDHYLKILFKT